MTENLLRNQPVRVIPGKNEDGTFTFRVSKRDVPQSQMHLTSAQAAKVTEIECYVASDAVVRPPDPNSFDLL